MLRQKLVEHNYIAKNFPANFYIFFIIHILLLILYVLLFPNGIDVDIIK